MREFTLTLEGCFRSGTSWESSQKLTSRNDSPKTPRTSPRPLKATPNSWKIEPETLPWPSCILFGQSLIFDDSTTNLHGFSSSDPSFEDHKSIKNTFRNHSKNIHGKTLLRTTNLSQSDALSPPKWHQKSMINRPGTIQGSPWRPKVAQRSPRGHPKLHKVPPGHQKWY